MSQRKGRIAVVGVAVAAAVVAVAGGAQAAGNPGIADNTVDSNDLKNGAINQVDLSAGLYTLLRTPNQDTVNGWSIKDGSIQYIDLSESARALLKGAKGDKGDTGAAGKNGTNGTNGTDGKDGANGQDGEKGDKGDTGTPGAKGDKGDQGVPGEKGEQGAPGEKGEKGDQGEKGDKGDPATWTGAHWGPVLRNTVGAGRAVLSPTSFQATAGVGALIIDTSSSADQATFGNEVDFTGRNLAGLDQVGFDVYTTGENAKIAANNMPSIKLELDPNVIGSGDYTTLVYSPKGSAPNAWTTIDAANDPEKRWGLTGGFFNQADRCGINFGCTFAEVKEYLATNKDGTAGGAKVLTLQVGKGRDFEFHGAVDNLVYNNRTFDFEPLGVKSSTN